MANQRIVVSAAGMTFTFELLQDRIVVPLRRMATRLEDLRRFWRQYWAPEFFLHVQKNFTGEGRFVGGWRALSPEYARWKRQRFGRRPILVATGEMKQSFVMGERNNVLNVSKARAEAGSRDRKVKHHQVGTSRMPRRQILVQLPRDITTRQMVRFLREEAQASGLEAAS